MLKKYFVLLILLLLMTAFTYGQVVLIRPNATLGYVSSDDINGLTTSYGLNVLLFANSFQRYGMFLDHFFLPNNDNVSYLRTGLIIEQVVFQYFNMGTGTLGYINLVDKGDNTFGLYTHLGFEYNFSRHFVILASYRTDFIFRRNLAMNNAFLLGVGLKF